MNAESRWGFPWLPNSDSIAPTVDLVGGNMTRAFSDDLRSRVLAASRDGMSARSAAARFGIGISTAIAWIASARAGQLTPAKQGRRGGSRLDAHENFIICMIEEERISRSTRWFCDCVRTEPYRSAAARLTSGCESAAGLSKKDRTCIGAGASRPPETSSGLVRRPTRSRSGAAHLHR